MPKDPIMLLSAVNMKLRDSYASLDALCEDMDVSREELVRTLLDAGYAYDEQKNQFI